jgi:hypothetical protein
MTVPGFLGGFWGIGGIGEVKGKKANNKFGFKEDQVIKNVKNKGYMFIYLYIYIFQ